MAGTEFHTFRMTPVENEDIYLECPIAGNRRWWLFFRRLAMRTVKFLLSWAVEESEKPSDLKAEE